MKKSRWLVLVTLILLVCTLLPMAASAETQQNGWVDNGNGTWSYWRDGAWVTDEVIKLGDQYYGFDSEGYMYASELFWSWGADTGSGYFYAGKDGTLLKNAWKSVIEDNEECWYYFGANAVGVNDFQKIGGVWYFFWNGQMVTDEAVYSNTYQAYYVLNKAGTNSILLSRGWTYAYGSYYYVYYSEEYGMDRIAEGMRVEDGGKTYYLNWGGKMAANEVFSFWDSELGQSYYILATADGSLLENGWGKRNGKWYYAENFALYQEGIYEIGGSLYAFSDYKMYDIPGEYSVSYYYSDCYVSGDGTLYRNRWREDTIGYPYEIGWVYYGDDGYKVTGLQTIGGVQYYFNYNGVMETDYVYATGAAVWVFDKDGKGNLAPNGWLKYPGTDEYMYVRDGGLVYGEIITVGGKHYAINYDGFMVSGTWYSGYSDTLGEWVYYLFGADGAQVTKTGWQKMSGDYFYVNADGSLAEGWKESGANWYYLNPEMRANTVFEDPESEGYYYAANNEGATTLLTGSGWRDVNWGRIYLVSGRPVIDDWKNIGGSWYYFDESGRMLSGGIYEIGEDRYVFDQDGKMCTGGWVKVDGTFYVDAAGIALGEGLHTIGGKQYLFSSTGHLIINGGIQHWNETYYWLNGDGSVKTTLQQGWNQIGSKWYYLDGVELRQNALLEQDGVMYGFGSDGAMCTDGVKYAWYDYYIFAADGHILTGWQNIGGKWYYAPDSSDPRIYEDGIYTIEGKDYAFKDGILQTSTTLYTDGYKVTTNADGVVTKQQEMQDGWNYTGYGYAYLKNGEGYTGWVGDYFIENGDMLFNEKYEYNGKYYWLGADGRYARSKWISLPYGEYMYADANGYLACSEWKLIGGKYYYFYEVTMFADGIYEIDGAYHKFDKNGVWKGEVKYDGSEMPTRGDGWQQIGGQWYYYHAGQPVYGEKYIGGQWYAFGNDGAMITKALYSGYYYDANGVRAKYVGWKVIDGCWCYFNSDNTVHWSWLKSGKGWYYLDYVTDDDTGKYYYAMVSNCGMVIGDTLYLFDANGFCTGATTKDGWYQAGGEWYYVQGGNAVCESFIQIGKNFYYFDGSGVMQTNGICYGATEAVRGYFYCGADGIVVTTAGWKNTEYGWVYITAGGRLYQGGIYRIGGKDYSFYDCIWVQ